MSPTPFLFASLDSKRPLTARKLHLRRLWDVLHLCIQRNDIPRACRAWLILARCKEIPWTEHWNVATLILAAGSSPNNAANEKDTPAHTVEDEELPAVDFLRTMMLQHPDAREDMLRELVLHLISHNRCREALDELELYLPSFPFSDNPTLHVYAGLTRLYLAQPPAGGGVFNKAGLRDAQSYFERALVLDKDNVAARVFLEKVGPCWCLPDAVASNTK
ncbi:uncharacterized protein SCHCODRAFT_02666980 [Schizophyllum commune H4-8]|uniref:ER membrane protein complex subunit 2 n=1 Tax=Schizophyllum commune (strain H4-8 / FGSC 9210) TaxID=578458 RepID=D8PS13_SCHCM|nr:uncharacterized protein SCHCODRAFT_02666980 [Schizophyllum commune H4-8]KAI5893910.1 hypothetical protein SCHCODRAFT_02666980 [Schizophyllum commune H4-8]